MCAKRVRVARRGLSKDLPRIFARPPHRDFGIEAGVDGFALGIIVDAYEAMTFWRALEHSIDKPASAPRFYKFTRGETLRPHIVSAPSPIVPRAA